MSFFYERKDSFELHEFERLTFGAHFHDYIEMVYLQSGETRVTVDSTEYDLRGGDVLIVFPNQIHAYVDQSPCHGVLCIFSRRVFGDFQSVFRQQIPASPVLPPSAQPPDTAELFSRLVPLFGAKAPFSEAILKGYMSVLLGRLFGAMTLTRAGEDDGDTVRRILSYCSENYQQELTLESLSGALHISKYHISHIFSQKIHTSFTEFVNLLRVEDACVRLREGAGVTQAALQSGFCSIRSFNRVFLRRMGMPPHKYQKLCQMQANRPNPVYDKNNNGGNV